MAKMTMVQALNLALQQEMARALDQDELRLKLQRIQPVFYLRRRHNIIGFTLNQ